MKDQPNQIYVHQSPTSWPMTYDPQGWKYIVYCKQRMQSYKPRLKAMRSTLKYLKAKLKLQRT